ncbi:uncharacterized protein METZ01_LOCUS488001, partial [marine metagenome]
LIICILVYLLPMIFNLSTYSALQI